MKTTKAVFGILSITLALASEVRAQSFLTNGLVAYYPFNGNAADATGNGNDGTVSNVVFVSDRFGIANSAASFAGNSSSKVTINSVGLNIPYDVTVSAWVLFTADGGTDNPRVLSTCSYELWTLTTSSNRLPMFGYIGASVMSSNTISSANWYHLVGVRAEKLLTAWSLGWPTMA